MGNPVVHFEFWSQDPARVSTFYEKVFAWKVNPNPAIGIRLVDTGGPGGIHGAILTPQRGPWPAKLALTIDVDDASAGVERIRAAGGRIHVERQVVEGVGTFALFEDPDGRINGIWQRSQPGKPPGPA